MNLASGDYREHIRCTGFYNQKFTRLKGLCGYLVEGCGGNLDLFFDRAADVIREELLGLNGIGKETADSILLYAGGKPVFVIDAYTLRLMDRVGIGFVKHNYDSAQAFFMTSLPPDVNLYRDYHALIDLTAKEFCRKTPRCDGCPLQDVCANAACGK
jgi:endonuclease-3 related protein